MPRMNGREVLTAVKTDPWLQAIPLVVFTTSAVDADVVASYTAHANAYIAKPIDLDDFERVVGLIHRFYGATATLPPRPARREDGRPPPSDLTPTHDRMSCSIGPRRRRPRAEGRGPQRLPPNR